MTEPQTPTGKRLQDDTSTGSPWRYVHAADILAIEAEAARQERKRIAAIWDRLLEEDENFPVVWGSTDAFIKEAFHLAEPEETP